MPITCRSGMVPTRSPKPSPERTSVDTSCCNSERGFGPIRHAFDPIGCHLQNPCGLHERARVHCAFQCHDSNGMLAGASVAAAQSASRVWRVGYLSSRNGAAIQPKRVRGLSSAVGRSKDGSEWWITGSPIGERQRLTELSRAEPRGRAS